MGKTMDMPPQVAVTGKQRMTPSEAFVESMVAQGVRNVFGIVGSAYMDALDLFPAAGIRFIPTVHEQGAAHMADGYARATGKVGVAIATSGPGATNLVTGIGTAMMDWVSSFSSAPEISKLIPLSFISAMLLNHNGSRVCTILPAMP